MSKYEVKTVHKNGSEDTYVIYSTEEAAFFAGYDAMGGVNWEKVPSPECELAEEDDPWQIVSDLEASDDSDDRPGMFLIIDGSEIGFVYNYKQTVNDHDKAWTFLLLNGIEITVPFRTIKRFTSNGALEIITNH